MSDYSDLGRTRIDEAIADGSLTPPPAGTGIDLEGYFSAPSAWRSGFSMLREQGFAPPELDHLKEAAALESRLESVTDPEERRALQREIEQRRVQFRLASEQRRASS